MSLIISFWWDLVILTIITFCTIYFWVNERFKYWSSKGIPSLKPTFPFGNTKDMLFKTKHIGEVFKDMYLKTKHQPYVGIYMMTRPVLLVNDLDLIKTILTKDFTSFSGHGIPFNEEAQPISGHLFNVDGAKWKFLRTKFTPTFTSSKMRMMFNIMNECSHKLDVYLTKNAQNGKEIDIKETLAMFSTDVIANCAFGIDCNTFENPDGKFRRMGKKVFTPPLLEDFLNTLEFFLPDLTSKLKMLFLNKEVENFFYNLVEETVNYRENNGIVRNDFMHLLIQLKNTGRIADDDDEKVETPIDDESKLTMMQIASQAFLFFNAGFETSSSAASFTLYELALNPDIQEKVAEEIDEVLKKTDGNITYDSLFEMTYLTKVVEEAMRKYPALPFHSRICTKNYRIPDTNITIEKGTPIFIPILAIQKSPEFFPDPEKFDPERFSPENKSSRHPFSYLPFGEGPRICIGSRFGMMQTKLGLVAVLSKFKVSVSNKTKIPITINMKSVVLATDGLFLKIQSRK